MMNFHHRKFSRRPAASLRQPDSLKLTCSIEVLKMLHRYVSTSLASLGGCVVWISN